MAKDFGEGGFSEDEYFEAYIKETSQVITVVKAYDIELKDVVYFRVPSDPSIISFAEYDKYTSDELTLLKEIKR